jgi:hypothetical protein
MLFAGARKVGLPINYVAIHAEDVGTCIAHLVHNPPAEPVSVLGNSEIIALAMKERASRQAA